MKRIRASGKKRKHKVTFKPTNHFCIYIYKYMYHVTAIPTAKMIHFRTGGDKK
jgi:hypothetical protein